MRNEEMWLNLAIFQNLIFPIKRNQMGIGIAFVFFYLEKKSIFFLFLFIKEEKKITKFFSS